MTGKELARQELQNLKGMPLKKKIEHILTYYWMVLLGIVIAVIVIVSTVSSVFFSRVPVLTGYCINAGYVLSEVRETMCSEFMDYAGIDTRKNTVNMFDNVSMDPENSNATMESQSLAFRISANAVDVIVSDSAVFEGLCQSGCFIDLRQILSPDQLARYSDRFVYTDRAVIMAWEETVGEQLSAPVGRAEDMVDPMPIGIILPDGCRFLQSYDFRGAVPVIGIVQNSLNAENAVAFLEYSMQ